METKARFKAQLNGDVIGWYDTAEEAYAAIEKAKEEEAKEEEEFYKEFYA